MTIKEFFEMYKEKKEKNLWDGIVVFDRPMGGPGDSPIPVYFYSIYKDVSNMYIVESGIPRSQPAQFKFKHEEDAVDCLKSYISSHGCYVLG